MQIRKLVTCMAALAVVGFTSCGDDDNMAQDTRQNISVNLQGLEDLGSAYVYEGWLIVDGSPVSTGTFTVDSDGNPSQTTFDVAIADATSASKFVLSIEPTDDSDPAPSAVKILAGDFSANTSELTIADGAALGTNFTASAGSYILATPTDGGMDTNENSGVWWLDPAAGPGASLTLPTLPAGWEYEGWAVVDGTPISTGKFSAVSGADAAAPFSGSADGPPFPGEDLLNNAPAGVTFPVDLAGKTVVISVEPIPDNSTAPFLLKPLVGPVPADAIDHTSYNMNNNASATNPTGSVVR